MPWTSTVILQIMQCLYATCKRKQVAKRVKITRVQEKGCEKWKLNEIIICYSNEYATHITDILNKIFSEEVP